MPTTPQVGHHHHRHENRDSHQHLGVLQGSIGLMVHLQSKNIVAYSLLHTQMQRVDTKHCPSIKYGNSTTLDIITHFERRMQVKLPILAGHNPIALEYPEHEYCD
jgi:hypothetical protein